VRIDLDDSGLVIAAGLWAGDCERDSSAG